MADFDLDLGDPASPYDLDSFSLGFSKSAVASNFGPAGPVPLKTQPGDFHFTRRLVTKKSLLQLLIRRKNFDSARLRIFKNGTLTATMVMRDFKFISGHFGPLGRAVPLSFIEEDGDAKFAQATVTATVADNSDADVGPGDDNP